MKKGRPEVPISSQTSLNEIRFKIKLKLSEWKKQARNPFTFCNFSQTKLNLESNLNFLNEKSRPEILLSSQTLLSEIRFKIKVKLSE